MSIKVSVGFMIPTNVVEVGNEITADQLAAITSASTPSAANPMATQSFVTGQNYIADANGSINNDNAIYARNNNGWTGISLLPEPPYNNGNTYSRSSVGTWEVIEPQPTLLFKANLCASCFTSNASTFQFTNYVAVCVAQGSKFTYGSAFILGLGYPNSPPAYTFSLTYVSSSIADTGISWSSSYGMAICYSEDGGSTWTYASISF